MGGFDDFFAGATMMSLKLHLIEQFCAEKYETNLEGLKSKFTEAEDRKKVNAEFREWLKAVTLRP